MRLKDRVEGETARRVYQLTEDDSAMNGSGLTVTDLLITASDGTAVDTTGLFDWLNQAGGTIYYDPAADSEVAAKSPYRLRVVLTDGSSKIRKYPNGAAAEYTVRKERG